MANNNKRKKSTEEANKKNPVSEGRRNTLKTLATVPVLGVMAYGVYKKRKNEILQNNSSKLFHFNSESKPITPISAEEQIIRIGIIGSGRRGMSLIRALGFATPKYIEDLKEKARKNSNNTQYKDYMEQDDLRVVVTSVCDIFDFHANNAMDAGANIYKEGINGKYGKRPKRYLNYKELLAANDVDAVIIATADHWHGTIAMDAVKAGKHVYLEKPMTWTIPETYMLRDILKKSNVVFQIGHQNRQIETNKRARSIIEKGMLGQVTLIETGTNRNDPNGAWVYDIEPQANQKTIDWKQFEGDPERVKEYLDYMTSAGLTKYVGPESRNKFSLERFFRWRCWWDYSTGLSGDLLTHEYDAMNQILNIGIPSSATSSGGIYFFKDGRTVPDVLQTVFEYKERSLTMLYSATLANQFNRSRKIMGRDATMEVGNTLSKTVDPASTLYRDKIEKGIIKQGEPFYQYVPGQSVDGISSATELYFAQRGLLYSFVNGKRYDTTFLHIREWLECIRKEGKTSCGIDEGFEEAITAHMGTRAYLEGRTMYWDANKEVITRG